MWIADAWGVFKQRAALWVGFMFVYAVLFWLAHSIPHPPGIGSVIVVVMETLLSAGVVYSCDLLRRERAFTFSSLFAGLKRRINPLVIVGLINVGFMVVLGIILPRLLGSDVVHTITNDHQSLSSLISSLTTTGVTLGMIFAGVISIVGVIICAMVFWFAPALVLMHNISPARAIKMSFSAFLKNIQPGIILVLVMIISLVIDIIFPVPKLLMTIPSCFLFICSYTSYSDIFFRQ
jgi:uncharacterized membrane protein